MSGTVARAASPLAALLPLTSLRFFAAFYIVLAHTYRFLPPWLPPAGPPLWAMRAFGLGYSLVGLFFVLSGFALACVYLDRPATPYIRIDRARFFLARFARLYPVYLAMLLLDSPRWVYILHFRLHATVPNFAAVSFGNLLLLQAWFPNHLLLPNIPAWSISVEVLFYALFPFVGPALWKMPRRYAAALGVALYAAGLGVAALIPVRMETDLALYYHPLAHVHEFLLGILLARFHVQYFAAASHAEPSRLRGRALLIGICALAVTFMAAAALLPLARYRVLLQHGALFPLYAALILLFCSRNASVERIFNARWLVRMGEASYGLYLVHRPLFPLFHPAIERYGWPALVYLAACIALSLASLRYLEAPARRRILEWHRARTQPRETLALASLS